LCDTADRVMNERGWEEKVLRRSNVEKIFLTNDFDDPLEGFDSRRYVPCLRTDDLVFHLGNPAVRERLAKASGIDPASEPQMRDALSVLFQHFTQHGANVVHLNAPLRSSFRRVAP